MLADSLTAARSISGNLGAFRSMGSLRAYYTGCGVLGRAGQRHTACDSFADHKGGIDAPYVSAQKPSKLRKLPFWACRWQLTALSHEIEREYDMSDERAKVVIIGAGFGGIEAAKALRRAPVEVTVIDRQNHHCFQPLLYQVATAALSPADVAWPIRHILRKQKNATVLLAEVRSIDTITRRVQIASVSIPYNYLVLATGAVHSYFGHDEWAEVAPGLKRIEDATRIRRRILIAFERAELATDAAERRRLLTFAIVGGGATGV